MAWSLATATPPCKRVAESDVQQSILTTFRVLSLNILTLLYTPHGSVPGQRIGIAVRYGLDGTGIECQ